jgi:hypothetical protein
MSVPDGFEVFDRTQHGRRGRIEDAGPTLRVPPGGHVLHLNAAAIALLPTGARDVELLRDPASGRIAFRPAKGSQNAYRLTRAGSGAVINARAAVREWDLPRGVPLTLELQGDVLMTRGQS